MVDNEFISKPIGPVSLIVIICKKDVVKEVTRTDIGPHKNPPIVMSTSFISYFRKGAIGVSGMRISMSDKYERTVIIDNTTRYLVC